MSSSVYPVSILIQNINAAIALCDVGIFGLSDIGVKAVRIEHSVCISL
ncbi:hypothetical protein [Nostoc sp. DSM 114160]